MAIAEFVVDVSRGFGGQAADACFDHLVKRVDCRCRDKFLCGLAARGLAPLEIKIRQVEENVFVKPNAEGKSRSVCTMLRRENDS